MLTKPLKWHGGKDNIAAWIHSLAPASHLDGQQHWQNGYTHRNYVFAGGLSEFWNWLPYEGISECCNDANKYLINFYAVLSTPEYREKFLDAISFIPLNREAFNYAVEQLDSFESQYTGSINAAAALAFFVRFRQSRQGLGRDYCTPTRRIRNGMNENVSAWLSSVDGLADCAERLLRVEFECLDFRQFIVKRDHKRALFYCDPPYWGPERTSYGEYGEFELQPWDHAMHRIDGRDLPYEPPTEHATRDHIKKMVRYVYENAGGATAVNGKLMGLLDILPHIQGKFMLSGYHSTLYDSWAERYGFKCYEKQIPNSASSSAEKQIKTECVWVNY